MTKLGIIGSGSGSNFQAIFDSIEKKELDAEIALVMSDNLDAFILKRAEKAGIPCALIDCLGYKTKFPDESQHEVARQLTEAGADLVCLTGFMRLVGQPLLEKFPRRILNIHPSLLPRYPGLLAWEQAIAHGATETGCTVHYVDTGMDTGDIILQKKVPIVPGDSPGTLHARIQIEEHLLYPEAIRKVISTFS